MLECMHLLTKVVPHTFGQGGKNKTILFSLTGLSTSQSTVIVGPVFYKASNSVFFTESRIHQTKIESDRRIWDQLLIIPDHAGDAVRCIQDAFCNSHHIPSNVTARAAVSVLAGELCNEFLSVERRWTICTRLFLLPCTLLSLRADLRNWGYRGYWLLTCYSSLWTR